MINFETARKKAKKEWKMINYCEEMDDAFVFGMKGNKTIGGQSPVVVMKKDGSVVNMTAYLLMTNCTEIIKEYNF